MPLPNRRSSSSSSSRRTMVGEAPCATADHDGRNEEVALVDESGPERVGGELWASDPEVTLRCRLQLPDRLGVEVSLDPRPGAGDCLQRRRVHDLVGRAPDLSEVLDGGWLVRDVPGLPGEHHLEHPPPVEVGADRPLEVVDERVHLLVRHAPVELALLICDIAVERCDGEVDQLAHSRSSTYVIRSGARRRCEFVWPAGPEGWSRRRRRQRLRLGSARATTTVRGRRPRSCRSRL